jgi:hypothetical protein
MRSDDGVTLGKKEGGSRVVHGLCSSGSILSIGVEALIVAVVVVTGKKIDKCVCVCEG